MGMSLAMQPRRRRITTTPTWRRPGRKTESSVLHWCAIVVFASCLVAGIIMLVGGTVLPAVGAMAGGAALAIAWGRPEPIRARRRAGGATPEVVEPAMTGGAAGTTRGGPGPAEGGMGASQAPKAVAKRRPMPGDRDLYLDLEAIEVQAVYVMGTELFTHLRGGVGEHKDLATGDQRHIETSDVSLTWRCAGRRTAERLAAQLNAWEARQTPLRLLAASGRCALLMEDDENWVVLPELRLAI